MFASFAQEMSRRGYGLVALLTVCHKRANWSSSRAILVWPSFSVTQDSVTCLSCVLCSSSLSSLRPRLSIVPRLGLLLRDLMQLLLGASLAQHTTVLLGTFCHLSLSLFEETVLRKRTCQGTQLDHSRTDHTPCAHSHKTH